MTIWYHAGVMCLKKSMRGEASTTQQTSLLPANMADSNAVFYYLYDALESVMVLNDSAGDA